MKKLTVLLLSLVAATALAQEPASSDKGTPVYGKTTPHPVIVPVDEPVKPVIKQDAAPRKSKDPAQEDPAKAAKVTATAG